jgi:hypothetical protein
MLSNQEITGTTYFQSSDVTMHWSLSVVFFYLFSIFLLAWRGFEDRIIIIKIKKIFKAKL